MLRARDSWWWQGRITLTAPTARPSRPWASGVRRVLLAADLNREASWPSAKVMRRLAVPGADESHSSELLRTCCLNDGFSHAYDRVIANFGASVQSQLLNDPAPSWAIGEFHKGIAARLKLEG
mmetsp:Transcript_79303/g.246171  ORF Transcript_79303/g.246171 Transcript_79303/m.246171 type:complete len:123 (-) Transcript_79303:97-465(-)